MITGRISAERILKQCMASSAATVFVAALGSAAHASSKALLWAYCDLRLIGSISCLALLLAWAAELRAATNTVAADDCVAQTQF